MTSISRSIGKIGWHTSVYYPVWTQSNHAECLLKKTGPFGAQVQWNHSAEEFDSEQADDLIIVRDVSESAIRFSSLRNSRVYWTALETMRRQGLGVVYLPTSAQATDFIEQLERDRTLERKIEETIRSISFQSYREGLILTPYDYQRLQNPDDKLYQSLLEVGKKLYAQFLKLHNDDSQKATSSLQCAGKLMYLYSAPRWAGEPMDYYLQRLREKAFREGLAVQPWIDATHAIWKGIGPLNLPTQSKMSRP